MFGKKKKKESKIFNLSKTDLQMGIDFHYLYNSPQWSSTVKLYEELKKKWSGNLSRIEDGHSIEKLGMERLKWTSMIYGLEMFFLSMNVLMDEAEEKDGKGHEKEGS